MTTVHLLRHGEVHNPKGVIYGRLPHYHLSERGEMMAAAAARFFAGETAPHGRTPVRRDITHIFASPLLRAQQTAAPVAASFGLPIDVDENLIEADSAFTGQAVTLPFLLNPKHWPALLNPFEPSWGEPYRDIVARMMAAVERARTVADGHEAVLVSHQLPIWMARLHLERRRYWHDPRSRQCALASVTSLRFSDGQLTRISYAEPAAGI